MRPLPSPLDRSFGAGRQEPRRQLDLSVTYEQDGKKIEPYGPDVKGTEIYDANGRIATIVLRPDLPKAASNNRMTATAEESQKIVHGSIAYFGTYTTNEADHSVTVQIGGRETSQLDGDVAEAHLHDFRRPANHQQSHGLGRWSRHGRPQARRSRQSDVTRRPSRVRSGLLDLS